MRKLAPTSALISTGLLLLHCALGSNSRAMEVRALWPANGATNVCPDTPLRITFDSTPHFTNAGKIILRAGDDQIADEIDLARNNESGAQARTIAGVTLTNFPVMVEGSNATIFPHLGTLRSGLTYRAEIQPGTFFDNPDAAAGKASAITWSFSTRKTSPSRDASRLIVAADGSGDFCTVQGAVDGVPEGNTKPVEVFIRNGNYDEIVYVTNKHHLTFRGEDRQRTVIRYANNEARNYRGLKRNLFRQMFGVSADDITIENLTLHNTTRKGGSQAEALRVDGARCTIRDTDFFSYQDTLKLSGTVFIRDCHIEGDVDFIWGFGSCFFTNCEIKSLSSGSYVTQIRNSATNFGNVFVDCRLTSGPGVSNVLLSRIELNRFPFSHVAFVNCAMGDHIKPGGWTFTRGTNAPTTLRFWEFQTTELGSTNLAAVVRRIPESRQISDAEAARMRDASFVLQGWAPH